MQELKINKTFATRAELEEYERELAEKYIIMLIIHKDQEVGKPDVYGIESIMHFGERK